MMRSLYSAVAGLKTHQTKMDVIGNNIANVNTVAFKSTSVTFQDLLYQTTSYASGANAATGTGGVNAKQIGLGSAVGSMTISIESSGSAESTSRALDLRLSDSNTTNFFIVKNGNQTYFTRAGSFYIDGSGNLCMTSTGYIVQGWQVDPNTGEIVKDTVSDLQVMSAANQTSAAEATTNGYVSGVLDANDTNLMSDTGLVTSITFYDKMGYVYTAKFSMKATSTDGEYTVELTSILDEDGNAIYDASEHTAAENATLFGTYNADGELASYGTAALSDQFTYTYDSTTGTGTLTDSNGYELTFGTYTDTDGDHENVFYNSDQGVYYTMKEVYGVSDSMITKTEDGSATPEWDDATGSLTFIGETATATLLYSTQDGSFISIDGLDSITLGLSTSGLFVNGNFEDVSLDYTGTRSANNNGSSTLTISRGASDGSTGAGKKLGTMIGLEIDASGKIYGSYDNGNTALLGQIAVAQFANASGLEAVGDNCYTTTLNSGDFDGIGVEISADGSSMVSGELEMSNVDLATEFTEMIITQRGFQANSRVITVSDTLLEELISLKRS